MSRGQSLQCINQVISRELQNLKEFAPLEATIVLG
jgi:hypothetical protein